MSLPPQSYALTTTATLASSSAFKGQNNTNVVALDTATQKDLCLTNGFYAPSGALPAGHFAKAKFPRYGEQIASPAYAPPVMMTNPLGTLVPVTAGGAAPSSILSHGHATSNVASTPTSSFLTQNVLDFFQNAVNVVSATGGAAVGLAAAAQTFLNQLEANTATTWGPAAGAIPNGTFIYDAVTTLGSAVASPAVVAVGGANGAGGTYIFSYGNLNLTSIAATATATDYVVIFCVGQINFTTLHAGVSGRQVLLVSIGANAGHCGITTGLTAFTANDFAICAYPGSVTNIAATTNQTGTTPGGYIFVNGVTATTNTNSYEPSGLSTVGHPLLFPACRSFTQYAIADLHTYDQVCYTPIPANMNFALFSTPGFAGGTTAYYNMTASTALIAAGISVDYLTDIVSNTFARICAQFGVVPGTALVPGLISATNLVLQAGCYYLSSTFFGFNYVTRLSFQTATGQVPNLGVSTEYHNFKAYFTPDASLSTAVWLQSYRVSDLVYAPIKNTVGGRYMCLNAAGLVAPSTIDYVFPTVPYYIETVLVSQDCAVSLSTGVPVSNVVLATDGGVDAYTVTGSGTSAVQATSTYRSLGATVAQPASSTMVTLVVPDRNWLDYSPLNGEVTANASSTGVVSGGKVRILNPNRQAGIITATLTVQPSSVAGETMQPFSNGADVIPIWFVGQVGLYVTYKDASLVRFSIDSPLTSTSENYEIAAGSSVLIGSTLYTYAVASGVGTLSTVSGGISTAVAGPWTFGVAPATQTVFLVVVFGDTLLANSVYNTNTITDGSVPSVYFIRQYNVLNAYGDLVPILPPTTAGQTFYLPNLTAPVITQLAQAGVNPVAGQPGYYTATVFHSEPQFFDTEIALYGHRVLEYTAGQTKVAISLADGTYTNRAQASVIVLNGLIDVSALPLDVGYITFTAVQVQGGVGVSQSYTIGTDYPDFPTASVKLKLDQLDRIGYSGVTLTTTIVGGKKVDSYTGSGSATYQNKTGGTTTIIFP
jgi:hypothetical protein